MTTEVELEEPTEAERLIELVEDTALIKAIKKVPSHLWGLSPDQIENLIKPSKVTKKLRLAFIGATRGKVAGGGKLTLRNLSFRADCSYERGHQLLNDPVTLVWVMRPIGDVDVETLVVHRVSLRRMADILDEPLHDKNGKFNHKLAGQVIDIFKYLDERLDLPLTPPPYLPDHE